MDERCRAGRMVLQNWLLNWMPLGGDHPFPMEGFFLSRRNTAQGIENCLSGPLISMAVQGTRRTVLGNEEYIYGENECLVAWKETLHVNYALQASHERPHLALSLALDRGLAHELTRQMCPQQTRSSRTAGIIQADSKLLDAITRLLSLCDSPEHIPHLAPMYFTEVHYRLLVGPQGDFTIPARAKALPAAWHLTEHSC